MGILVHKVGSSGNGIYCSNYIHITSPLNWSNYFDRLKYDSDKSLYKLLNLRCKMGSGNYVNLYVNNLISKITTGTSTTQENLGMIISNGSGSLARYRHLVIFNTKSDVTISNGKQYAKIGSNNYYTNVIDPRYEDNKLKSGNYYLAFLEYFPPEAQAQDPSIDYYVEYYTTNPRD